MNVGCEYSISRDELENYLNKNPSSIALFSKKYISNKATSLTCILFKDDVYYEYVANVQIGGTVAFTNVSSSRREIYNNGGVYDLIYTSYLNEKKHSNEVYFDIVTSYNIYKMRKQCNHNIEQYSNIKIFDDVNKYLADYDDLDYLVFLNIYLGVNGIVLNNEVGRELIRDYTLNEENSHESFYNKLNDYYNSTYAARADVISYITATISSEL